jgi:hypothetical protein
MRHAGALFFELGQRLVHHRAAEVVDGEAFDAGVFAIRAGHRHAVHHAFGMP